MVVAQILLRGDELTLNIPDNHCGTPLRLTGRNWCQVVGHTGASKILLGEDNLNCDELYYFGLSSYYRAMDTRHKYVPPQLHIRSSCK